MMHRFLRGVLVVAVTLVAAGKNVGMASPPGNGKADLGKIEASSSSTPRPAYDCYKGGFCGTEGWATGWYAKDTKESTGCGMNKDGVDTWDAIASRLPTMPDFARPYCSFFYGMAVCGLPTIICEN